MSAEVSAGDAGYHHELESGLSAREVVAIVPGGGTYGMEAVARQFATGKKCLVVRNGWFSLSLDADF